MTPILTFKRSLTAFEMTQGAIFCIIKNAMVSDRQYFIYIVASDSGTIYIGVTNNLLRRITEHKESKIEGFTKKYHCHKLIYYEIYGLISAALYREKELKKWNRLKKQNLIKTLNPAWKDLFNDLLC